MPTYSRRRFVRLLPGIAAWKVADSTTINLAQSATVKSTIQAEGNNVLVRSHDLEVSFVGLGISRIQNSRTGREYLNTKPAAHLILTDNSPPGEPRNGLIGESNLESVRQISPSEVEVRYKPLSTGLPGAKVKGSILLDAHNDEVSIEASVELESPGLAAVIHPLWGLSNRNELLFPVFGGLRFTGKDYAQLFFDPSTKEGITAKPIRLKKAVFTWPNALSGCFAIYKVGENEGFWIRSEDPSLAFKVFSFEQTDQNINLSLWTSVDGSPKERTQFTAARWKLQIFQGPWQQTLKSYKSYLAASSPAWKYKKKEIPWSREIRLVLNQFPVVEQKPNGTVHDNPKLIENDLALLRKLSELVSPKKVLIYPFHWQLIPLEYGSGVGYPDWTPSPGFAQLNRESRKMGYRVMPHLNYFAISPKNAEYRKFEPYILRDPASGKKMGWLFNEEKEQGMGYVHPGAPGWFEFQLQLVKEMLKAIEVDAIFWDQTLNMLNAANFRVNGKTTIEASLEFLRRMRESFPHLAFGGEGVTELTVPYQDFVQVHTPGVYALTPFDPDNAEDFHWGLNPETFPMRAPMVSQLFADRVELLGYAAEPDTRSQSFGDWVQLMKDYRLVTSITGLSMRDLDDAQGPVRHLLKNI